MKLKLLLSVIILSVSLSVAQTTDDWKFTGQVQLRTELDGRDFSNETYALLFTSLRTRLAVEKNLTDQVQFFVQIQDSRMFGQEPSTLASINGIDLHQGYVN